MNCEDKKTGCSLAMIEIENSCAVRILERLKT
jgi:hypothetical protein